MSKLNKSQYIREVEKRVLKVYRDVSPSYRKLFTKKDFIENYKQRINILRSISLPEQTFYKRKILEIGGGTGENSIFYSLWGANVTIVDPNEISLKRAKELYKNNNLNVVCIKKNLFELKPNFIKSFDIVICEGVFQHTAVPSQALERILKSIRKGSIFMIAIAEKNGFYKRTLQRKFIKKISKNNQEIILNAKKYFKLHLDRASRFGLRSKIAIIYDTYINPQVKAISLKKICELFYKNKFYYLSSYPSLSNTFEVTPWSQAKIEPFNYKANIKRYKMIEKLWRVSGNLEESKIINSYDINKINMYLEKADTHLKKISKSIDSKKIKNLNIEPIQKGYLGQGMNYFVGVKK